MTVHDTALLNLTGEPNPGCFMSCKARFSESPETCFSAMLL